MDKPLSEESKDALRAMMESEGWRLYAQIEKEAVKTLRVTAKFQDDSESRIHYYDLAQGREDAFTDITSLC